MAESLPALAQQEESLSLVEINTFRSSVCFVRSPTACHIDPSIAYKKSYYLAMSENMPLLTAHGKVGMRETSSR
jgi:hypothetical protein